MNNKQEENIKFSICIPYHNCGAFIDECLHSVVRQTYKNWEIIIFNDGSSTEEAQHLHTSVDRLSVHLARTGNVSQNIRIIDSENIGLVGARCAMWKAATGDVVVNVDSDDYLFSEEALQKIADCFNSNEIHVDRSIKPLSQNLPLEMVIYNTTRSVNAKLNKDFSRLTSTAKNCGENIFLSNVEDIRREFCCFDQINNIWIKAVRRDVILPAINDNNGEFDRNINMTEDIYLSTFIIDHLSAAAQIPIIDEPLYFYRVNESSTVFAKFNDKRLKDQVFVQKILESYATWWDVQGFNAEKHTAEYLIYGDIMYVQLSDASSEDKIAAYKRLRSDKFISERIQRAVKSDAAIKGIPRHKRIPLKMFADGHYKRLLAYFSGLEKLKSLKR